jgi:hypothetical protein
MLRSLFIAFFMTGSAMALIPAEKPPSSLLPRSGKVTLRHSAQKTIGCVQKSKGRDLKCVPELATITRSAAITLHPVAGPGVSDKEQRQAVKVTLSKEAVDVPLARGIWELEWQGRSERERFFLGGGDELAIALFTQLGGCKKSEDDCVLTTEGSIQKVNIPKDSRR